MEKYSIREVVGQAIQTEKLGYQFYMAMAEKFRDKEKFHSFFAKLATYEQRHEKVFTELGDMLKDEEPANWDEIEPYLRAIVESEFFLGKNKALPAMEHVKTMEDAVNFAIGFEKETLLYFYGVRDVVKEKEIVEEMINEERSHIMWLNKFKESLIQ